MSLILDALRKLERDQDARDPGVLVVGSVPWGATSRARPFVLAGLAAVVLALAVGVGWLLRSTPSSSPPPAAVAQPSASLPPAPSPSAAPSPSVALPVRTPVPAVAEPMPLPVAPPVRLSRPLPPASAPAARPARAAPDAAGPAPAAAPVGPSTAAEPSPDRLPVAPAGAGAGEAAPAPRPGELRLNAISQRDGKPVALINDRLVFEGDSFDGVRVLRIGETEVELEVRGERRVLRF